MRDVTDQKVFIPEVVETDEQLPADLVALRRFARFMDEAVRVPGTPLKFGLDAALGLIPGIGDAVGGLFSAWIIVGALRHRVPVLSVTKMVLYVALDIAIGSLPVIGDVFDFLFEENVVNMTALLKNRDRTQPPRSLREVAGAALLVVIILAAVAAVMISALAVLVIWLIRNR